MEVTTEALKRCHVVRATGRIDSQTAPQLEEAFRALTSEWHYKIVFDMSGVEFVSSAALRAMIDTQKTCKQRVDGELVLAGVPERIYETLELTGFVPLFKFFENTTEAVGSF